MRKDVNWILKTGSVWALMVPVFASFSCKTSAPNARLNQEKKEIEVVDTEDKSSTVAESKKRQSIDEAIKNLKERLKTNPSDSRLLQSMATLLLLKGDAEKAKSFALAAIRNDLRNDKARVLLASIEFQKSNMDLSEIILNSLSPSMQKDPQALNLKALIALKREDYDTSLEYFKKVLQSNNKDLAARMNLGTIYLKYRQIQSAKLEFEKVLEVMPDHQDALLHYASVLSIQNESSKANEIFEKVLERNSQNRVALFNQALLLKKDENSLEKAQANCEKFLKLDSLKDSEKILAQNLVSEIKKSIADRDEKRRLEKEAKAMAAKELVKPRNNTEEGAGKTLAPSKTQKGNP